MASTKMISWSELAKHNTLDSLWVAIHGNCYDLTEFIKEHPGGPKPLKFNAGGDGTIGFDKVKHSDDAKEWRKKFFIGKMEERKPLVVRVLTHPLTIFGIGVPLVALLAWRFWPSKSSH